MFHILSISIGFLELRVLDIIDIVLVSVLLYYIYQLLKGSIAFNIFIGIALLYSVYFAVKVLNMYMLSRILGQFIELGVIAFVILFQPEIRRFLLLLGKGRNLSQTGFFHKLFYQKQVTNQYNADALFKAMKNISNEQLGALIVVTRSSHLPFVSATGVSLNADLSAKLLESIFEKKSPLHDGAVILADNKILAAGCTLTLSENQNLPKRIGTRHRAAVGISETSDAVAFVVSEETGKFSVADAGNLAYEISDDELIMLIQQSFNIQ
jgi:diadenylate cyclase